MAKAAACKAVIHRFESDRRLQGISRGWAKEAWPLFDWSIAVPHTIPHTEQLFQKVEGTESVTETIREVILRMDRVRLSGFQ